jgi:uncharacterized protein YyaL (SSP411 family)
MFQMFAYRYGVEPEGNVHEDPHGEFLGKNILYVRHTLTATSQTFHLAEDTVRAQLEKAIERLLEARSHRIRPHLDDKILTSWNGLMISALAKGAQVLGEQRYLEAAQNAATFILTRMIDQGAGVLNRRFRDGEAAIAGFLDDYAFLIAALLDLYEADFNAAHLKNALALTDKMMELFEDPQSGGFFSTAGDASLVLRMKDDYDGAEPSGNSIALLDLLRVAHLTDRPECREAAERTLRGLASKISSQPVAVPQMLVGLDYYQSVPREIVIVGDQPDDLTQAFLRSARAQFLPQALILLIDSEVTRAKVAEIFPAAANMEPVEGRPTAYVCKKYACELPTNDISKFNELLQ